MADDILEELIVNIDAYPCAVRYITEERESFTGLGVYSFLSLWRVQFDEENNQSQFVDVTFTVTEGPVRFERDLKMLLDHVIIGFNVKKFFRVKSSIP